MADKVIVYTQRSGIAAVCVPAPQGRLPNEGDDAWIARVIERSVPADATDVRVVPTSSIPSDRTFRNAWTVSGNSVDVDMPLAREVHRNRIRFKRKALLAEMDAAHQRADDQGDAKAKAEIGRRRQQLRDAPAHPDIDAAQTPDQLKAVWPI